MNAFRLGEVSITRVVEIGRSFYPTADMLPESGRGRASRGGSPRAASPTAAY